MKFLGGRSPPELRRATLRIGKRLGFLNVSVPDRSRTSAGAVPHRCRTGPEPVPDRSRTGAGPVQDRFWAGSGHLGPTLARPRPGSDPGPGPAPAPARPRPGPGPGPAPPRPRPGFEWFTDYLFHVCINTTTLRAFRAQNLIGHRDKLCPSVPSRAPLKCVMATRDCLQLSTHVRILLSAHPRPMRALWF